MLLGVGFVLLRTEPTAFAVATAVAYPQRIWPARVTLKIGRASGFSKPSLHLATHRAAAE